MGTDNARNRSTKPDIKLSFLDCLTSLEHTPTHIQTSSRCTDSLTDTPTPSPARAARYLSWSAFDLPARAVAETFEVIVASRQRTPSGGIVLVLVPRYLGRGVRVPR